MPHKALRIIGLGLVLVVLAACSQPPTDAQPEGFSGQVLQLDVLPQVVGAGLMLWDPEGPVVSMSVTQISSDFYLGPIAAVDASGEVSVIFPDGSALPTALMTGAENLVGPFMLPDSCTLMASDASAKVTATVFELITLPGVAVLTVEGLDVAITVDAPVTLPLVTEDDLYSLGFQTWVYADRPVDVTTVPSICLGEDAGDFQVGVDVTLAAGWNQLEWTLMLDDLGDLEGVRLGNSNATDLYFIPMSSLFGVS